MKGHQDTKQDHVMTTPKWLNVDCDRWAAQVPIPCPDPVIQNNPIIKAAYLHVMIAGKVILQQLQHNLRDVATFPTYSNYLQTKFEWTSNTTGSIHWKVHQLANQHLSHSEWQIITKFIHEWLPLLDRYHVLSSSQTKQCPSCHWAVETTDHFLNCSHLECQQIWTKLHDSVYKLHVKQNAPPQYYNAMAHGLYAGCRAPTKQTTTNDNDRIQNITQQQEWLGWKQLYYGRITEAWATEIMASQETSYSIPEFCYSFGKQWWNSGNYATVTYIHPTLHRTIVHNWNIWYTK